MVSLHIRFTQSEFPANHTMSAGKTQGIFRPRFLFDTLLKTEYNMLIK